MGAAKKIQLAPDEIYIQEALKDGRATIQEVSLKALGRPDVAFQARVKHIDMDHVHRLSLIHDQEGRLSPIVVFHAVEGAKQRWIVADGFHRHEVYRRKGERAIRAYVVDVPMDSIEHEARLFAAMCNQVTLLTRTPQDVRRAVDILLSDPEAWQWSNKRIASHCGCGLGLVDRARAAHAESTGIPFPKKVIRSDGVATRFKRPGEPITICSKKREDLKSGKQFFANVGGKQILLGCDEQQATSILDSKIMEQEESRRRLTLDAVQTSLLRRGFNFEGMAKVDTLHDVRGRLGCGVIFTTARFDKDDSVPWAVGCLLMLRVLLGQPAVRLVCVCYKQDARPHSIEVASNLGIEFLTPDELVESLKGEKGS